MCGTFQSDCLREKAPVTWVCIVTLALCLQVHLQSPDGWVLLALPWLEGMEDVIRLDSTFIKGLRLELVPDSPASEAEKSLLVLSLRQKYQAEPILGLCCAIPSPGEGSTDTNSELLGTEIFIEDQESI